MDRIPTYIINLPTSIERKKYIENLLSPYTDYLSLKFIEAIKGKDLTEEAKRELFNFDKCVKHLGRFMNDGEIGCTLSHRKCYQNILKTEDDYALIFEDDISIMRDFSLIPFRAVERILTSSKPRVVLLSGDTWYFKKREITKVYEAIGAYSYFINRAAAEMILKIEKPYSVADDWPLYKRLGLELYALIPYFVDANLKMELFSSDVKQETWGINRRKMALREALISYQRAIVKKTLKKINHFESKIKVRDGKIVPGLR